MAESLVVSFDLLLQDFRLAPEFSLGPELGVLFGPSGSGKTLTLKTLAGLIRPDRGSIRLNGQNLYDSKRRIVLPPQARRIGYVPQHFALFPHRSLAENVGYGLHDVSASERRRQVAGLLGLMKLADLADRRPAELSSGQQQRAALARALARRPNLLLMDEPFAAVEEDLRAHLRAELVRVQHEFGIPVLLVTHSLSEAYSLAERLVVLRRGVVMQQGNRDEVYRRPQSPEVARLMGMNNILTAEITGQADGQLNVGWNGVRLVVSQDGGPAGRARAGGSVLLGVRPEEIEFAGPGHPPGAPNRLTGLIARDIQFGPDHLLEVQVDGGHLEVRVTHPFFVSWGLAVGQARELVLDPARFHLFPNLD